MSKNLHSESFQGRANELRIFVKKRKNKGIIALFFTALILLVLFINRSYPLPLVAQIEAFLFIILLFVSSYAYGHLFIPLDDYNWAFLDIVESLEIIEKSGTTSMSYNEASKKILQAYSRLVQKPRKPWLKEIIKIEQEFYRNLKFRVAPAIKDNKLNSGDLTDVLRAMQSNNVDLLKAVNVQLTAQYEEKILEKTVQTYITSFLNTFLGKIILSGAITFSVLFGLIYASIRAFELDFFITIQSNLITIIAVLLTSTIAILNIIKDKEFFK